MTAAPVKRGTLTVTVLGDTAEELETRALDLAREFFGPDTPLNLGHFAANATTADSLLNPEGKAFVATVAVDGFLNLLGFTPPEFPDDDSESEPPPCTCFTTNPHAVNCRYRFWMATRGAMQAASTLREAT